MASYDHEGENLTNTKNIYFQNITTILLGSMSMRFISWKENPPVERDSF